jgi:hypothetical protein
MPWGAAIAAGGAIISSSIQADAAGDAGSSSQNKIDPRIEKYIYGADGNGGLLGDANAWYQGNKTGLNDQMRQGLNQQWQTYNDPSVMAGYRQQQNLGSGLLGAPVMGNPFSDGRMSLLGGSQGGGGSSLGGPPARQQFPSYQPAYGGQVPPPATAGSGPFAAPPPAAPSPVQAPAPSPYSALPPGQLSNEYQGGWRLMADPSTGQPFWADKNGNNVGFYDGGNTGNGGA